MGLWAIQQKAYLKKRPEGLFFGSQAPSLGTRPRKLLLPAGNPVKQGSLRLDKS